MDIFILIECLLTCILTIHQVMCAASNVESHMQYILLLRNYSHINIYTPTVGNILYNVGNFETVATKFSYMAQYTKT